MASPFKSKVFKRFLIKSLLDRYRELLKEFFGDDLLSVAVFGSFARQTAKFPGSDLDLLIVVKGVERLSFGERIKQVIRIEKELSQTEEYAKFKDAFQCYPSFQEIILTPEELKAHPPILLDLTIDTLILYDSGILEEELDKIRRRLKELGARRVKTGDTWFWILKPDLKLGEEVEI